jgi:alpha-amylase
MRSLPRTAALFACALLAGCGGDAPGDPTGPVVPPPTRPTLDPTYRASDHAAAGDVFVHLFEWPWPDVATECEEVLAPLGFRAAQVSPPQEHVVLPDGPWWERYQPASYSLERSRSGTEAQFRDMVRRCAAAGVDIYVDAVINHMAAADGTGSAGTAFTKYEYPALWSRSDFHSACAVSDYMSAANVQDCELLGLADLDTGRDGVQARIAEYLLGLVRLGVAGFRIDAAKHIQPVELDAILDRVNEDATREGLPRPWVFAEVIDYGGEAVRARDYFGLGYGSGGAAEITEFRYRGAAEKFAGTGGQRPADLAGFSESAWGLLPSDKAVVFLENHDTQRGGGLRSADGDVYRLAHVWMLAQPYGYPKVMSGYAFAAGPGGRDEGPPSDPGGTTLPVRCAPRLEEARVGEWTCEHRDPVIGRIVAFRRAVAGAPVTGWWDDGDRAIAFSRGDRGFVALSLADTTVTVDAATPLDIGAWCDVLGGGAEPGRCAGRTVEVGEDGRIRLGLAPGEAVAIHVGARP